MKAIVMIASLCTVLASGLSTADSPSASGATTPADPAADTKVASGTEDSQPSLLSKDIANFCFFAGTPPPDVKYATIKKLKAGKGTYGGIRDILPKLATHARQIGADAIIEFEGSQRFGVLPWRIVRPVVRGVAIKWSDGKPRNCAAIGGTTLQTILATDRPPPQ